jgi:hypothetical protein
LSWQGSFTWAKTLTHGGIIDDIYDPNHYYGPASGSVPKSFNGSAQYELPGRSLHNLLERAVLAGWEFSGTVTGQAGTPFSLTTSSAFVPLSKAPASLGGTCTSSCTNIANPTDAGTYLANGNANSLVNVPAGIKKKGFSRAEFKYGVFSSLGYTFASKPPDSAPGFTNPSGYGVTPVYSSQGYNSFQGPG